MESTDAQRINAGLVLRAVATGGATSRRDVVRATGLSKATVSRIVRRLIDARLVHEGELVSGPDGGRATQILVFDGGDELVCGVDMGGTNTRVLVVDQRGRGVGAWRLATAHPRSGSAVAEWLVEAITSGCPEVAERGLRATVVGVPGAVAPATSQIRQAPNLRALEGAVFAERLDELLPGHVTIANDSNLALAGEMAAGAAVGLHDVAMITIGTGVGAGVALNGQPLTGPRGLVGEFGSLPVALDGTVVEDILGGAATTSPTRAQVVGALYTLCAAMSVAYDLDMIVFGGRGGEALGDELDLVRARLSVSLPAAPTLTLSRLGDAAGALGAVALGLDAAEQLLGADPGRPYAEVRTHQLRTLADAAIRGFEHATPPRRRALPRPAETGARTVASHRSPTRMDVVT